MIGGDRKRETDRQSDRQTDSQTDRQTDRAKGSGEDSRKLIGRGNLKGYFLIIFVTVS